MTNVSARALARMNQAHYQTTNARMDRCTRCVHSKATRDAGKLWCKQLAIEVPAGAICDEWTLSKPLAATAVAGAAAGAGSACAR
jgi:hypothetical protein